jgi:hypothetical protein
MSSRRSARPGSERPQVQPRVHVVAKVSFDDGLAQIAVGAGEQLEIGCRLAVCSDRQQALVLDRAQDHRLLVETEFTDLVEEQHSLVGGTQQPGAIGCCPGKGTRAE